MQTWVHIYALAHFNCGIGKIPFSSLYDATENELQGPEIALSKNKTTRVLKVNDFDKNRLPFNFDVEVGGDGVAVKKKHLRYNIKYHTPKIFFGVF